MFWDRKNHDGQRRDRTLRLFFLRWAIFSTIRGDFLTKIAQKTWRNLEKSTGENSRSPVETAPQNCRFLSLVVVERVLKKAHRSLAHQTLEACAMTTKFLDTLQFFCCHRVAFQMIFLSAPQCLKNANFIFIVVSPSLKLSLTLSGHPNSLFSGGNFPILGSSQT